MKKTSNVCDAEQECVVIEGDTAIEMAENVGEHSSKNKIPRADAARPRA